MNLFIHIRNVSKILLWYQVTLDDVSLEMPSRCVFGLLGESGAGKSTLIKILLGLVDPDHGSTFVLGSHSQTDGLSICQRVGSAPGVPLLYDWMTVAETGRFTVGFYSYEFQP